jgi:hypothetical protein
MVVNARWLPYVIADGVEDELVPVTGVLEHVKAFDDLGYRYSFSLYPAEDHLVYATQDGFSHEIAKLGTTTRVRNPAHVTYRWYPVLRDTRLGLGPTGAYWIRGLRARVATGSTMASVDAVSHALPNPSVTVTRKRFLDAPGDPTPAVVTDSTWAFGRTPRLRDVLDLRVQNVAELGVDMARARLTRGVVDLATDGRTIVRLLHLPEDAKVVVNGRRVAHAQASGSVVLRLPRGTTRLLVR